MPEYRFSSRAMTVWVKTENETIIDAAAIVHRFKGQPLHNLAAWMSRQDGLQIDILEVKCKSPNIRPN